MLESRPEDALDSLVQTVETAKTVKTVETVETVETVNTVEPVETVQTVFNEDLKKYELLTHLLCDNLKARDASASKNYESTPHYISNYVIVQLLTYCCSPPVLCVQINRYYYYHIIF